MPRGVYPRGKRHSQASAQKMTAIMQRRLTEEPERVSAISSENGKTACSYVYVCPCGREFNGPSAYHHAKRRNHGEVTVVATPHDTIKETP